MRLTRFGFHGVIFYLMMLGAFFASPYSNLFFLLLAFLTLQWCVCLAATHRNLRGVEASLSELRPVPSGTRSVVPARLQAPGRRRFQITARILIEGREELSGQVDLLDENASLTLEAPALARGCYAVEGAVVESSYPFGMLLATREVTAPLELIVYPAPKAILEGRSASDALDELLGRDDSGPGDLQPSGLRDHREGDGLRAIHWRASARRGRLVVQEWEGGSGQGLEVVLDRRCSTRQLEEALSTISAMVTLARENKETLTLHSQELSATFGEGHLPWIQVLRFLAGAEVVSADGAAPPSTSPAVARLPRLLAHA